eukprot:TsM_000753200 transcript=TsM_000753200 gene=TsM_000753200
MADQYQYAGIAQPGQAPAYPQFAQYPGAGGDQSAQFLQGYALAQGNPAAAVFGGPSFGQTPYPQGAAAMPVPQLGAQLNASGLSAGFPYGDYSQFNPYGQNASVGMTASINDVQQFGQLLPNALNQSAARNIYEAIAQEQGLAGFNAAAFMQDTTSAIGRLGGFSGKGFGSNQRAGMNKYENGSRSSNLPSVTNPDGLREDTVFVSKLPQNIDHEVMKSHFGTIGKIKMNAKTGMPMIWIFKERGIPKGDALVTFEDPQCVQKAIKWFSENEFLGKKIEVKQAKNSQRPVIIPSGGGQQHNNPSAAPNRSGSLSQLPVGSPGVTIFASVDRSADMYGGQFDPRNDGPLQSRCGSGRPPINAGGMRAIGGPGVNRGGDWCCQSCGRLNFAGRDQCKPCGAPRPDDGMMMSRPPQRGPLYPPHQIPGVPTANGGPMMAPGGPPPPLPHRGGPMMPPPPGVRSGAIPPMNGGRGGGSGLSMRGGRGGGPMRGSSISAGRNTRAAPY